MEQALDELTDKEKQTLRLIVRGHDAKSMAAELDLSVHTVNERLRVARRKLGVTSSREAARLLFESEGGDYENFVGNDLGVTRVRPTGERARGLAKISLRHMLIIGGAIMLVFFAALALSADKAADTGSSDIEAAAETKVEIAAAARAFLERIDAGDWRASYDAAGAQFRAVNTLGDWAEASRRARLPYGEAVSRELVGVRYLNAPPRGFQEVTFSTRFANGSTATETVTMQLENDRWKAVGILIG